MKSRELIDSEMRKHYEQVWQTGDAWEFQSSPFEEQRYQQQLSLVNSRHHHAVLEIGCGSGVFTPMLAQVADHVLALDIAEAAIQRAKNRPFDNGSATVEFLVA